MSFSTVGNLLIYTHSLLRLLNGDFKTIILNGVVATVWLEDCNIGRERA